MVDSSKWIYMLHWNWSRRIHEDLTHMQRYDGQYHTLPHRRGADFCEVSGAHEELSEGVLNHSFLLHNTHNHITRYAYEDSISLRRNTAFAAVYRKSAERHVARKTSFSSAAVEPSKSGARSLHTAQHNQQTSATSVTRTLERTAPHYTLISILKHAGLFLPNNSLSLLRVDEAHHVRQ